MNFNEEQAKRFLDSLLTLCQDSAERGDLPAEVYADMFELAHALTLQVGIGAAA